MYSVSQITITKRETKGVFVLTDIESWVLIGSLFSREIVHSLLTFVSQYLFRKSNSYNHVHIIIFSSMLQD